MKKIAVAFTVLDTPWHVLTFATKIAKEYAAMIHGIFLNDLSSRPASQYPFPNDLSLTEEKFSGENITQENSDLINDNIKVFKDECDRAGISYKIDEAGSAKKLLEYASDADIIIADTKADFLEKILPDANCPVCLVSGTELPAETIIMYDGGSSCKHAIEKYISCFPSWSNFSTQLVSINPSKEDEKEIEEYANNNLRPDFKNFATKFLYGNEERLFIDFLNQHSQAIVIIGAFGRSDISRFFRKSFASAIPEKTGFTLFIAHT